jgi:hypothetical protein
VFIGSFECPVPTSVSGLFKLKSFWPKGVKGGISGRSGVRLPAQEPVMSWTGAGPQGVGSGLSLLPLYNVSFPGSFCLPACASAADEKTSTASKPIIDLRSEVRISEETLLIMRLEFSSGHNMLLLRLLSSS